MVISIPAEQQVHISPVAGNVNVVNLLYINELFGSLVTFACVQPYGFIATLILIQSANMAISGYLMYFFGKNNNIDGKLL